MTWVAGPLAFRAAVGAAAYPARMASPSDLRPRTVGELLDGSFFLYRRYFGRFLIVATVVSLRALVIAGLTAKESTDVLRDAWQNMVDSVRHPKTDPFEAFREQLDLNVRIQIVAFVSAILQSFSRGAAVATMAVATWAAVNRLPMPGARGILRSALPRLPGAALAFVAQSAIGMALGPLVCCLPLVIIVTVLLTPVPAIVMFEQGALEQSLRSRLPRGPLGLAVKAVALPAAQVIDGTLRGFTLGWHAGTIARGTSYVFFVMLFVSFFVSAIAWVVAELFESGAAWFWMQHYCEVVFLPVVGISVTLWYVDLRVRREAADLLDGEIALA